MLEIAAVVILAVAPTLLFLWLKWRKLERDPRQTELANYLVRLVDEPDIARLQIQLFAQLQGWSDRETANRIAHALGIPEHQMPRDQWRSIVAVGQALGCDYRHGRMK